MRASRNNYLEENMTLGRLLATIAENKSDEEREVLKKEFLYRVKGHRDENLLMDCFRAADLGRTFIFFGGRVPPPAELLPLPRLT